MLLLAFQLGNEGFESLYLTLGGLGGLKLPCQLRFQRGDCLAIVREHDGVGFSGHGHLLVYGGL